jgi:hypothetical protein
MVHYSGYMPDVIFFTDGEPWKMAQPRQTDALVRPADGDGVILVQQAYYNGHYGFTGTNSNPL